LEKKDPRSISKDKSKPKPLSNAKKINFSTLDVSKNIQTPSSRPKKDQTVFVMKKEVDLVNLEKNIQKFSNKTKVNFNFVKMNTISKFVKEEKKSSFGVKASKVSTRSIKNVEKSTKKLPLPPPKEESKLFSNETADFACCSVCNVEEVIKRIKCLSEKKQWKFTELGIFKYSYYINNDNERKIQIEFTSINKTNYLMKIFLMSNYEKEDKETVKEILSLGIN